MKTNPLVSIIIPTYNRINTINRAINSALNQVYNNHEIIVISDGSTDGTIDFVSKEFPGIKLINLNENKGVSAARNAGINIATGDFIAFLDSDDQWMPEFLSEHIKILQNNGVLSFCNYNRIDKNGLIRIKDTEPDKAYTSMTHHLLVNNCISTMSIVVVRKDALLKAGPFNEKLRMTEDRELYLRLSFEGEFKHIPKVLASKYIDSDNLVLDYEKLLKNLKLTIKIFFLDKRSYPFRHVKNDAERIIALKTFKYAKSSKNSFLLFKSLIKVFYYSLFSLKNTYDLIKKIINTINRNVLK